MYSLGWRRWTPQALIDFRDAARFELATAWGRMWQRPYRKTDCDYLQVGAGGNRFPGFLNTNHFIDKSTDYCVDIRYPLPFPDQRWVGIYAHHIVEHVWYHEALNFFRECRRVLRPSGILRVVVPDVERFIRIYAQPPSERMTRFREMLPESHVESIDPPTAMGFISYAVYSHPMNAHHSAWDREIMQTALQVAGFDDIVFQDCGRSADPKLSGLDTPHWASQSLYVEARAPQMHA